MDIAQYISDLLARHEEVGLPGIGTFFKRKISAYYNSSDGLFYPPSYVIDFKNEEGSLLLVEHIIDHKHISESSANYFIERFSENIKNNLQKSSNVSISPLGTLIKTDTGYALKDPAQIPDANYFGLKPVKEPEVLRKTQIVIPQPNSHIIKDEPKSSSKGIWITLFIILLLAALGGLAYFYYPQYFKDRSFLPAKKPQKKTVKPVATPDSVRHSISFADSIVNTLEKQGMSDVEIEKAKDTATVTISSKSAASADTANIKTPEKVYEIIVSASDIKREAEAYVKGLRKKGVDAKVISDNKKPAYKVSAGSFTSQTAANKELRRVRQDIKKDAWLLTITN